jgi:hypothetical protein
MNRLKSKIDYLYILSLVRYYKSELYFVVAYEFVVVVELEIDLIVVVLMMVKQSEEIYLFELLVFVSLFVVNRVMSTVVVVVVVENL